MSPQKKGADVCAHTYFTGCGVMVTGSCCVSFTERSCPVFNLWPHQEANNKHLVTPYLFRFTQQLFKIACNMTTVKICMWIYIYICLAEVSKNCVRSCNKSIFTNPKFSTISSLFKVLMMIEDDQWCRGASSNSFIVPEGGKFSLHVNVNNKYNKHGEGWK